MKKSGIKKRSGFTSKTGVKPKRKVQNKNATVVNHRGKWSEIKKLDYIFSQFIRLSHSDNNGNCKCITCNYEGFWKKSGIECGHFKSRGNLRTRWHERNAGPQCIKCNRYLNGNIEEFQKALVKMYGKGVIDELESLSATVYNPSINELKSIRKKLEIKVAKLKLDKNL